MKFKSNLTKQIILINFILFFATPFIYAGNTIDSSEVKNLLNKSRLFLFTNPDSSLFLVRKAKLLSEKINYPAGIIKSEYALGVIYNQTGQTDSALSMYDSALELTHKINFTELEPSILSNSGLLKEKKGDYISALNNFITCLHLYQKKNDKEGIGKSLNNIGIVFREMGNDQKSVEYFYQSIALKLECQDTLGAANGYNNVSVPLLNLKKYKDAIVVLEKALKINTSYQSTENIGSNLVNLGLVYDNMGNKKLAREYYTKSISVLSSIPESESDLIQPLNNLGTIEMEEGDLVKAISLFKRSLDLAIKGESVEDIHEAYGNLAQAYSISHDYSDAFENLQKYNALSDTLSKIKSDKQMSEMMVKFQSEQKERENKLLNNKILIQQLNIKNNRYIIYSLSLFLVLIFLFGVLIARQRKLKADQKNYLIERRLLQSQMNPHFIFNSLQSIQGYILNHEPESAAEYLSDFAKLIRLILEHSREDFCTVREQLDVLEYYLKLQQLRFENLFEFKLQEEELPDLNEFVIPTMLLQPVVENSIEHGFKNLKHHGLILINIYKKDHLLYIEITDNGVGRSQSEKLKQDDHHQSMATQITAERIINYNRKNKEKITMEIIDMKTPAGDSTGTKVIFAFPENELHH